MRVDHGETIPYISQFHCQVLNKTGEEAVWMAGSITEKSIINDYAKGPAVTNYPSRRSSLFAFVIVK